jgi:sirohydrochlorin ferrochelatase
LDRSTRTRSTRPPCALYPNVTAGNRNGAVYTPVSAILHHAGVKITVERPKGYKGKAKDAVPAAARCLRHHQGRNALMRKWAGC